MSLLIKAIPADFRIVGAALLGAVGGLAVTAAAMGFEFGIFGTIGGAIVSAIAAAIHAERSGV